MNHRIAPSMVVLVRQNAKTFATATGPEVGFLVWASEGIVLKVERPGIIAVQVLFAHTFGVRWVNADNCIELMKDRLHP